MGGCPNVAGGRAAGQEPARTRQCGALRPRLVPAAGCGGHEPPRAARGWGEGGEKTAGVGRDAALMEGDRLRRGGADPVLGRLDHVRAIGRRAVADNLRVDPGAARLRELEILEEQRSRALPEDETV